MRKRSFCIISNNLLVFLRWKSFCPIADNMSRRTAFLDAACKENSEDFLRFIELHVSVFLIINNNNNKIRSAGICMFITP